MEQFNSKEEIEQYYGKKFDYLRIKAAIGLVSSGALSIYGFSLMRHPSLLSFSTRGPYEDLGLAIHYCGLIGIGLSFGFLLRKRDELNKEENNKIKELESRVQ